MKVAEPTTTTTNESEWLQTGPGSTQEAEGHLPSAADRRPVGGRSVAGQWPVEPVASTLRDLGNFEEPPEPLQQKAVWGMS